MLTFDLQPWEIFEAPVNAAGHTVPITKVWIDDEQRRIYGDSEAWGEPVWLSPDIVPARVLRRDPSTPRHPLEWRELFRRGRERALERAKPKVEDRLAAIPPRSEPELVEDLAEIPGGMRRLGKQAAEAGFVQQVRKAEGPRVDQYNNVLEISPVVGLRGDHPDGRRFIACYVRKTGERGAQEGVQKWDPDFAYAWIDGRMTPCGVSTLPAYFTNGSLTT